MPNASVKVKLDNDVQINGQKIPAGTHDLPPTVAEDAKRIDDDYKRYLTGLHQSEKVNAAAN